MTSNEILKADVLDILFEQRNKQYGAYQLRKYYNGRLGLSLVIALTIAGLIFLLLRLNGSPKEEKKIVYDYILKKVKTPVNKIPERIKPKRPKANHQPVLQKKFTDDIRLVTRDVQSTMPHIDDPGMSSDINTTGVTDMGTQFLQVQHTVEGKEPATPAVKEPSVQSEPEFPGGVNAWLNFLRGHLQPPMEMAEGEKKTVMIRFEVGVDGSVSGFQVLQSAGKIFDNEVIRVLRKMPRWKPAIQNNQPVARSFTQPVTFIGIAE